MARNKVTVIGAGNVGATTAQRIAEAGLADVVLVDIVEGLPQGKGLDLAEAAPVVGPRRADHRHQRLRRHGRLRRHRRDLRPGPPAGHEPRRPAREERRDRQGGRRGSRGRSRPNAILIVVTNPLDAMCHVAMEASGFPRERVLGMAGVLDSARFRTFIADGARRLGRGHPRVRPRRPRRHDGPAAALLDGRRHPDHRAAARRSASRRSSSGRPTAAPRSWRCSRPARRTTPRPRRRSRWSTRSCATGSGSCRAPSCSRASTASTACSSGVPVVLGRRRHGAGHRDHADRRRAGRVREVRRRRPGAGRQARLRSPDALQRARRHRRRADPASDYTRRRVRPPCSGSVRPGASRLSDDRRRSATDDRARRIVLFAGLLLAARDRPGSRRRSRAVRAAARPPPRRPPVHRPRRRAGRGRRRPPRVRPRPPRLLRANPAAIVDPAQGGLEPRRSPCWAGSSTGAAIARLLGAPVGPLDARLGPAAALRPGRAASSPASWAPTARACPTDLAVGDGLPRSRSLGLARRPPSRPIRRRSTRRSRRRSSSPWSGLLCGPASSRGARVAACFAASALWAVGRAVVAFTWRDAPVAGPFRAEQLVLVLVVLGCLVGLLGLGLAARRERRERRSSAWLRRPA